MHVPSTSRKMKKSMSMSRNRATLCPLILAFVTFFFYQFGVFPSSRGAYNWPDSYQKEALKNLTSWRSSLFKRTILLYKDTERQTRRKSEPQGHDRFGLLSPFVRCPRDEPLERVGGKGDGGKLLCLSSLESNCIVYSLGSNNNYHFEEGILKATLCKIFTFDCSVEGRTLNERHLFIKKCLGTDDQMMEDPENWVTLEVAMKRLGHKKLDVLKIDIEGSEYDVFSSWLHDEKNLPMQIAVELHYLNIYAGTMAYNDGNDFSRLLWPQHELTLSDISLFMLHMTNMGYAIVSREDNEGCMHCSELTLVRIGNI